MAFLIQRKADRKETVVFNYKKTTYGERNKDQSLLLFFPQ